MNKKALSIALIVFMALSMCGCFLLKPAKLKTTLTTEYSDSDVVSFSGTGWLSIFLWLLTTGPTSLPGNTDKSQAV